MSKKKEAKTNAMRLLDALHIPYRHYSYECREFVDARHTAEALNLAEEKMYKTLVTEGAPRQYYVFVIPIGAELSLKKAARTVGEKALSMLPVKDITAVTGYVRGAWAPARMFSGRLERVPRDHAPVFWGYCTAMCARRR